MHNITPPTPSGTFEARYSQSTAPKYEPTSGPPIIESPDKARTMPLQKSAGATRLASWTTGNTGRIIGGVRGGNDAAGAALGIR